MPRRLNLPDSASVITPGADGRLNAPSAERNAAAITTLLTERAPHTGRALEIASGTGQHVVGFARALPGLAWHPSDIDPDRRASIDAWAKDSALPNIAPAIHLDATAPGWAKTHGNQTLIVTVNLLHLISEAEAKTLVAEAAQALHPGGHLVIYGPFLRDGDTTSDGDAQFHASLQAQDPEIGYKDDFDVIDWIHHHWLDLVDVVEMPANNLGIVAKKPG